MGVDDRLDPAAFHFFAIGDCDGFLVLLMLP